MELKLIASHLERSFSRLLGFRCKHLLQHVSACSYQKSWDYAMDDDVDSHKSYPRNRDFESMDDEFDNYLNHRRDRPYSGKPRSYDRRQSGGFNNRYRYDRDFNNGPRSNNFYGRFSPNNFNERQRFPNSFASEGHSELQKPNWDSINLQPFEKNFYNATILTEHQDCEDASEFRKSHNIFLKGDDIPNPVMSFSHYQFPSVIQEEISSYGFDTPTPIQAQGWPIALSGRDFVGIGQTGSGKTLGYVIPGLIHMNAQERPMSREGPIALVLAPTRELVQQINGVADPLAYSLGMRSTAVFGGASKVTQLRELRKNPSLCIATPGRLLDFLRTEVTNMRRCTYLVIDEADRMLDMGFEPQIRAIIDQIRPDRQTLMWSATWPNDVKDLAKDYLTDYVQVNIGSVDLRANPNIKQTIEVLEKYEKRHRIVKLISDELNNQERILVFAQTKRSVDYLVQVLNDNGIRARGIHGDHSQASRDRTLNGFRSGTHQVLIATDVASRGLDVNDIGLVVNYDFPNCIEDYVHRIGRTGRADKTGSAITFFTHEHASLARDLVKVLRQSNQQVDEDLMALIPQRRNRKFG